LTRTSALLKFRFPKSYRSPSKEYSSWNIANFMCNLVCPSLAYRDTKSSRYKCPANPFSEHVASGGDEGLQPADTRWAGAQL